MDGTLMEPPAEKSSQTIFSRLWRALNLVATVAAPLAILGFVFLLIPVVDAFATHVQFMRALERDGVARSGVWAGTISQGKTGSVTLSQEESLWVWLPMQYYSVETRAGLRDGRPVRVRYVPEGKFAMRGVLESSYPQVRSSVYYLREYFWPLAVLWLLIVLSPDFLFLGMPRVDDAPQNKKGAA